MEYVSQYERGEAERGRTAVLVRNRIVSVSATGDRGPTHLGGQARRARAQVPHSPGQDQEERGGGGPGHHPRRRRTDERADVGI